MEPRERLVVTKHLRPGPLAYGVSIGAAAFGIGLGGLLLCWGLSWLWPHGLHSAQAADAPRNGRHDAPIAGQTSDRSFDQKADNSLSNAGKTVPLVIRREVTEFWSARHEGGEVTTGWQYADGRGGVPLFQYCYYSANVPGAMHKSDRVEIAIEGQNLSNLDGAFVPDLTGAQAKCQWWTKEIDGSALSQAQEPERR
jgi:hypothetical protein